ncbi:uncharacterized protein LOC132218430 isoform X2 [Myotis daubentonii]|uniref:uncharacterized protein LOC132218430 isoform X2 n=1 Tax=Myotis daubentonii TaxID=98922 RepID=UPI0028738661|nr:uncharacterized protein LOC132218430 isoform X2 [Myotis daubentonii]
MTSINVRCWAPLRSALAALPLLLLLLALSNLHQPPPANVSRFKVRETYHQNSKQVTQQVGSQDCPLVACQTGIRVTVDIQSVYNGGRPYACFAYDQEDPDRSLLAAVPLTTSPRTQGKGECQPPVAGIPLWEPETPEPTLPPRICYQTSNPVIGGRITWNSSQNYIASSHTKASPAPYLLKFIRSRIAEMSRVTVNQLLLHPYTRLPSACLYLTLAFNPPPTPPPRPDIPGQLQVARTSRRPLSPKGQDIRSERAQDQIHADM